MVRQRLRLGGGWERASVALTPQRRGEGRLEQVWARWRGPLGLVWLQRTEAPDRAIKQLIDRTGLEATRSKLEQDYYDKGIPRTQAREKAALDIQQATRTLAKPDTVSAQGTQFERPYDPTKPPDQQPGVYAVPKGLPAPEEKPLSEGQMKAVEFALKMDKDLGVLHSELKNGKALTDPWEATKAMAPIGSNYIVSDEYRRAKNIMGNFMASYLSHVSGASVTPSEYTRNVPAYMPSPGDTDKDLADKAQRQRDFLAATRAAGGQRAASRVRPRPSLPDGLGLRRRGPLPVGRRRPGGAPAPRRSAEVNAAVTIKRALDGMSGIARRGALLCIRAYQKTAPLRPPMCRYQPSCSEYTAQCIQKYGVFAGVALGLRRILRCNPFTPGGYDPMP